MKRTSFASLFLAVAFVAPVISAWEFKLKETHVGEDFFANFVFETEDDPTHGRTNYVDMATARHSNLSFGL